MAKKTGSKLHGYVHKGTVLNVQDAAKLNGVKTRYMAMCTWRPGGKRKKGAKHGN